MSRDQRVSVYTAAIWAVWSVVFVYTIHPILPDNAIQIPYEDKSPLIHLVPQGWGFFTLNPRSPHTYVFTHNQGEWELHPENPWYGSSFLGFSREPKLLLAEAGLILDSLPDSAWAECKGRPETCLGAQPALGPIHDIFLHPTLCGDIGIVRQPAVPWAWSHARKPVVMPSQVLRVSVLCQE